MVNSKNSNLHEKTQHSWTKKSEKEKIRSKVIIKLERKQQQAN